MRNERDALHKTVFPKLRELCMEHGARFQAIDLRWGVRREAALDQKTMRICLEEIKRCQKITPRPNFIILLGNRYGWRPLPFEIPVDEFEAIVSNLNGNNSQEQNQLTLLKKWYIQDDNATSPMYCLQPREGIYVKDEFWRPLENKLRSILISTVGNLDLSDEALTKYLASATEQEIIHGALKIEDNYDHVFCFFRNFETPLDSSMGMFSDMDEKGKIDKEAQEKLHTLKQKLKEKLPHNFKEYPVVWNGKEIEKDYISELCTDVENALSEIILKEIAMFKEITPLEEEINAHKNFAKERRKNFVGRKEILKKIKNYILNENYYPLAVYGESGSGKSALMAQVAKEFKELKLNTNILVRFIGITPNCSNSRDLLESITHQLYQIFGKDISKVPTNYKDLLYEFRKSLSNANEQNPLIIILDALDQISSFDEGRNLAWLPVHLPKHVRIIISTTYGKSLNIVRMKLPTINLIELDYLSEIEGYELLKLWLEEKGRSLQPHQYKIIMNRFLKCRFPLYLKLASEEARHWRSYTEVKKTQISKDISGIIEDLFKRLSLDSNHGEVIVSCCMTYLALAKNGLTEDEIIDIITEDPEIFQDFIDRSKHKFPIYEQKYKLPFIIWSRFYHDIEPYLTYRSADGTNLLNFFHNQFKNAVIDLYLKKKRVRRARHLNLVRFFVRQELNPRKISELPYNLTHSLPSLFKYFEKEEESFIVLQAIECLVKVSRDIKFDLVKHIEEIVPIASYLLKIKNYKHALNLIDEILEELENQCYWIQVENLSTLGMKSAEKLNRTNKKALFLYSFARILLHRGQYKKSEKICKEALNAVQRVKNKKLEADILWHLGTVVRYLGKTNEVFSYVEEAERIAYSINDINILIKSLITKGITEHGMGNFDKALEYYNRSFELYESIESSISVNSEDKNPNFIPSSKSEIIGMLAIRGIVGYQTKNISLARDSWFLWLKMAEEQNAERDIKNAKAKLSLIDSEINLGDMKQIFKELLEEFILTGEQASAVTAFGELAEVCIRRKEYNEAIDLCKKALVSSRRINNLHIKSAKIYVKGIKSLAQGRIKKANKLLKKSENFFAKWTSPYRFWVSDTFNRLQIK